MNGRRSRYGTLFALTALLTACDVCDWPFVECRKSHVPESECWEHPVTDARASCSEGENEPNDTMPMSEAMDVATCTQEASRRGAVGRDDVDYFHAKGTLCGAEHALPALRIKAGDVRACLFVQCRTGSTSLDPCPNEEGTIHLPNGLIGCCRRGPGDVSAGFACTSKTPDIDVYVVVDQNTNSLDCQSYEVAYSL